MTIIIAFIVGLLVGWMIGISAVRSLAKGDGMCDKEWSRRPRRTVA